MMPLFGSFPLYIGVGGRFHEPTELGAEYAHRSFQMLFRLMKRSQRSPVRADGTGRVCLY
jgi:hypothetical protein